MPENPEMILYYFPRACSLAAHIAIEESGYSYTRELVNIGKKENKDAFVAKYDTEGKLNWIHIFKGKKLEECTVSLWTSEGDLLVGGYTESSLGDETNIGKEDSFLAKLSLKDHGKRVHQLDNLNNLKIFQ